MIKYAICNQEYSEVEKCNKVDICSINIIKKRLLWIKENQIFQVKEFGIFMGRCKSLGSVKSFLSYASQLLGPVPCDFSHLEFFRLLVGSGCSLMADRSQVFFFFLSDLEGWNSWWLWHPCLLVCHVSRLMFTDYIT